MDWIVELFTGNSVAHSILALAIVAATGLALGSLRLGGAHLGVAGVLFAGLAFGHFGLRVDEPVLEFTRELGLVLFVYTIGMQVGPGFLSAFKREGLPLNGLAVGVVGLGALLTVLLIVGLGWPAASAVGVLAGATTNTPSLASAQQALAQLPGHDAERLLPGLGYAVAYPFGVAGILLVMVLLRALLRIDVRAEGDSLAADEKRDRPEVAWVSLVVTNPALDGITVRRLPLAAEHGVVISRVLRKNTTVEVAHPETILSVGDAILAVGPAERLEELRLIVGGQSSVDVRAVPSRLVTRRILVTQKAALGKTLADLGLLERHGVTVTRVSRADVTFSPHASYKTQFGDSVLVVGEEPGIEAATRALGDSPKELSSPQVIPLFVGLALGVLLGSWPWHLPGVPAPVRLGLAGGPLLVAIVLSRIGRVGPLIWYLPISANIMLRDLGIILFLACVGLRAGAGFVATLQAGQGLLWLAAGAVITIVPILAMGLVGRLALKTNFLRLCGVLAGSMTDPPALAFATTMAGSDAPSLAYSTVYPLVMILRVIAAQAIVLLLA